MLHIITIYSLRKKYIALSLFPGDQNTTDKNKQLDTNKSYYRQVHIQEKTLLIIYREN